MDTKIHLAPEIGTCPICDPPPPKSVDTRRPGMIFDYGMAGLPLAVHADPSSTARMIEEAHRQRLRHIQQAEALDAHIRQFLGVPTR